MALFLLPLARAFNLIALLSALLDPKCPPRSGVLTRRCECAYENHRLVYECAHLNDSVEFAWTMRTIAGADVEDDTTNDAGDGRRRQHLIERLVVRDCLAPLEHLEPMPHIRVCA